MIDENKLFIPVLLGTQRRDSNSSRVAKYIHSVMDGHPEIETRLFKTEEMDLSGDEGQVLKEKNSEWRDSVVRADGLVIVAPEYNHGYPGSLKMTLDTLLEEYKHKAVGICAVSAGVFGGARMIEHLIATCKELGLVVQRPDLNFPKAGELVDEDGNLQDKSFSERTDAFLSELVWMAKTLRHGRENIK